MNEIPLFPEFKDLELNDRDTIQDILWQYQPQTSELTFTNMFIWRKNYQFRWAMFDKYLLIIAKEKQDWYGFQPIGSGDRTNAVSILLRSLKNINMHPAPRIERADKELAKELEGHTSFRVEKIRHHFDYLYLTKDLIELTGRKYHTKKNYISSFLNNNSFDYEHFTPYLRTECFNFLERWYQVHTFEENPGLSEEQDSILELMNTYDNLRAIGAVIRINGRIEALTFGEMLNNNTAVIHIEKANTEYRGLYAVINQIFCQRELSDTKYINREQDLGNLKLRKAKESYHPYRLVEKYRITGK
jgi:hypothetical protein